MDDKKDKSQKARIRKSKNLDNRLSSENLEHHKRCYCAC